MRSAPAPSSVTPQPAPPAASPRQGPARAAAAPFYSGTPIFVKFDFAFQLDVRAEDLSLKKMLNKTNPFYLNTSPACIEISYRSIFKDNSHETLDVGFLPLSWCSQIDPGKGKTVQSVTLEKMWNRLWIKCCAVQKQNLGETKWKSKKFERRGWRGCCVLFLFFNTNSL